ncbi:hypothetical protein [Thermococcus sp.]
MGMDWEQFKENVRKDPLLMAGVILVVLGIVLTAFTWIWMGVLLIFVILLMGGEEKVGNEKEVG